MADHNDPNAVNSIFSDIDYSAADLYDLFGFPTHDGQNVLLALTFSATPKAGELDSDMLYRLLVTSHPRVAFPKSDAVSLDTVLNYFEATSTWASSTPPRSASPCSRTSALVKFPGFPCGDFSTVIDFNQVVSIKTPDGQTMAQRVLGLDDLSWRKPR